MGDEQGVAGTPTGPPPPRVCHCPQGRVMGDHVA